MARTKASVPGKAAAPKLADAVTASNEESRAKRVSQADVPRRSLRDALTVAQALTDNFASSPTAPHQIAIALGVSPTSSSWRDLTGSTVAYGLTKGAYNSDKIALEHLGLRCTAPTAEGDDVTARAEAALKPKVFAEFFGKYDRNKFPPDHIAKNVLQHDFAVPAERTEDVLAMIKDNGKFVGFIQETKTGPFVSISDLRPSPVTSSPTAQDSVDVASPMIVPPVIDKARSGDEVQGKTDDSASFKVFITHGKNMSIVDQVKDVLELYDIEYEIAIEEETAAIPVPQKVLSAMRRCKAGIMIVSSDEQTDAGDNGKINNNVLIEVGAAFVLYDQKVVLLWEKGLKVPSNLQGLYRCDFEGGQLSFAVGTKLAKAVKGFRV